MGQPPRYGVLCPRCGSLDRHRLLALANAEMNFFKRKEVLHFAPEPQVSSLINEESDKYLSADLEPGKAQTVLNIESIDQKDNSWDIVLASHVLEHVNDELALREMNRILRPGGLLLVMVPIAEGWKNSYEDDRWNTEVEREIYFGQKDHVRFYGADIRQRFRDAGFHLESEFTATGDDCVKHGLSRGEKIFICAKPAVDSSLS